MRFVLLGAPGAGKGTLAAMLKDSFKLCHISTGDMLREEMKQNSSIGKEVKTFIDSGKLVPDDVVMRLIEQRLTDDSKTKAGYILDGYPRTETQADQLDKILTKIHKPLDYALYLESTLPVIIKRLTGRRVCRGCGHVYHVTNRPPKKQNICDVCGGELYQRADDKEETIKTRMEIYIKSTTPVIKYYEEKGILKRLNSDEDAQVAYDELMQILDDDGKVHKH